MSIRVQLGLVIVVTLLLVALIALHTPGMNGPEYHPWHWRRLPALRLWPAMLAAAIPFFLAQWLWNRRPARVAAPIALMMLGTFALQFSAASAQPPFGLKRVVEMVKNTTVTSYYTDAKVIHEQELPIADVLEIYPEFMERLHLHAKYKPPGLVLFYYAMIQIAGPEDGGALLSGIVIGILATLTIPATYWLIRHFSGDRAAAFCGASFIAIIPSLVLFFPQSDQLYPTLACAMLIIWSLAIMRDNLMLGALFGLLLWVGLFLSPIVLIMGLFIAAYSIFHVVERGRAGLIAVLRQSIVAIVVIVGMYLALWVYARFDPIETMRVASQLQEQHLVELRRPFPMHMVHDVIDFIQGTGWVSALLVAFYLISAGAGLWKLRGQSKEHRLVVLALLQIIGMACTALLPGESSRLWLIMMPLLMAPIGFELSRWSARARLVVYACVLILTIVICQNMAFLFMGHDVEGTIRPEVEWLDRM